MCLRSILNYPKTSFLQHWSKPSLTSLLHRLVGGRISYNAHLSMSVFPLDHKGALWTASLSGHPETMASDEQNAPKSSLLKWRGSRSLHLEDDNELLGAPSQQGRPCEMGRLPTFTSVASSRVHANLFPTCFSPHRSLHVLHWVFLTDLLFLCLLISFCKQDYHCFQPQLSFVQS